MTTQLTGENCLFSTVNDHIGCLSFILMLIFISYFFLFKSSMGWSIKGVLSATDLISEILTILQKLGRNLSI